MTDKAKTKAKVLNKDTKTVIRSFVRLAEATALLTVATYSGCQAYANDFAGIGYKLLTVAAVLIGLRGAEQFLKHLANK